MKTFKYRSSPLVPFREEKILDRVRKIKRKDMDKHPNPDYRIRVIPDQEAAMLWILDMFYRIKQAADESRPW